MVIHHVMGLFVNPRSEWEKIRDNSASTVDTIIKHVSWLALIPTISGYIGTTQVGWTIGSNDTHFLTAESAGIIAFFIYFGMIVGILGMGYMIKLFSESYGEPQTLSKGVLLAAYVATPLFLIGFMLLFPILWLNMLLGMVAVCYCIVLLYMGLPIVLEINQEKGFLFSTAILGLGLVAMVTMLAATVIIWGYGFAPMVAG